MLGREITLENLIKLKFNYLVIASFSIQNLDFFRPEEFLKKYGKGYYFWSIYNGNFFMFLPSKLAGKISSVSKKIKKKIIEPSATHGKELLFKGSSIFIRDASDVSTVRKLRKVLLELEYLNKVSKSSKQVLISEIKDPTSFLEYKKNVDKLRTILNEQEIPSQITKATKTSNPTKKLYISEPNIVKGILEKTREHNSNIALLNAYNKQMINQNIVFKNRIFPSTMKWILDNEEDVIKSNFVGIVGLTDFLGFSGQTRQKEKKLNVCIVVTRETIFMREVREVNFKYILVNKEVWFHDGDIDVSAIMMLKANQKLLEMKDKNIQYIFEDPHIIDEHELGEGLIVDYHFTRKEEENG